MLRKLKMIIPLMKQLGLVDMIKNNADSALDIIDEKIIGKVELLEGESQACIMIFNHSVNGEQTKMLLVKTVNEKYEIMRKIKVVNLKKELQNLDIDNIINNISLDGGDEEE